MDHVAQTIRKEVYVRLEQADRLRWDLLLGGKVRHSVFGHGTIANVFMPDWSNPIRIAVKFGTQVKVFHLASFGDRSKFPEQGLPDPLGDVIARAEQEIAQVLQQGDLERRQVLQASQEAEQRVREQQAARERQLQLDEEALEALRQEEVRAWLSAVSKKVEEDQDLSPAELRSLVVNRNDALLLQYHERSYARRPDARALARASSYWRGVQKPEYAYHLMELLVGNLERFSPRTRALLLRERGSTLLDLHRLAEAKECAQQAVDCDSTSPDGYTLLGAIFKEAGSVAESARALEKAQQLRDASIAARQKKGQRTAVTT